MSQFTFQYVLIQNQEVYVMFSKLKITKIAGYFATATLIVACGGGGSNTADTAQAGPNSPTAGNGGDDGSADRADPDPSSVPDYSSLKTSTPSEKGLRKVSSATEFELFLKNGLRLSVSASGSRYGAGGGLLSAIDNGQPLAAEVADNGGNSGSFSATNVQEQGVDEGDIVKYDGSNLFVYKPSSYQESFETATLRILSTDPSNASSELKSELELPGSNAYIQEMYLVKENGSTGSIATIGGIYNYYFDTFDVAASLSSVDVSYGGAFNSSVTVGFYDVSDTSNPSKLQQLELEGSLQTSRKIGNTLYLVSRYSPQIEGLVYYGASDAQKIENEDIISNTPIANLLPKFSRDGSPPQPLVAPENCLVPEGSDSTSGYLNIVTVTAIDLSSQTIVDSSCMNSPIDGIYVSPNNIFMGATLWEQDVISTGETTTVTVTNYSQKTNIHQISLNSTGVEYQATGVVDGTLGWDKPHFRMSEHNGDLRMVTTDRTDFNNPDHKLHILRKNGVKISGLNF